MNAYDLLTRNSEETERIGRAQIVLRREWKSRKIFECAQVAGSDAGLVKLCPIRAVVRVGACERSFHPPELKLAKLLSGETLIGVAIEALRLCHNTSPRLRGGFERSIEKSEHVK